MTSSTRPSGCAAIERAFQAARAANRCALITFLTLGYPSPAESPELVLALARGGADLIELGVPFSDPVADGPAIQESSFRALEAGMTPTRGFEMVRQLRAAGIDKPLLLMGYYNPLLSYGLEAYVSDCVAVGVDGLIVPDLPPEEAEPLESLCRAAGLALVFLVTPTSDEARVTQVAQRTTGFLYVVSQLGTTGGDLHDETALASRLAGVRDRARTPVAVGFGVSRPEQVRQLAPQVDGVIVGSAVVRKSAEGPGALQTYVRSLREATARGSAPLPTNQYPTRGDAGMVLGILQPTDPPAAAGSSPGSGTLGLVAERRTREARGARLYSGSRECWQA